MGRKLHYIPGSNYVKDDRSGFPMRVERTRGQWDNLQVDQRFWEPRQPQDFVKGVPDRQNVGIARPLPPPAFSGPIWVQTTANVSPQQTQVYLADTSSFQPGSQVGLMQDDGVVFNTITVNPITADYVTLAGGAPTNASSGNLLINYNVALSPPSGPERLEISGSRILLGGQPFRPLGVTVTLHNYTPGDMALVAALGANMVRVHVFWYNGFPLSNQDAYDPGAPGNFDPTILATALGMVAEAQSQGLWVDFTISGGGADFWSNTTVQTQFYEMWQFLAATLVNEPFIMGYELLTEPHPSPANAALVASVYSLAIGAVRTADGRTPTIIGPSPTYDIRYMPNLLLGIPNTIYTFNDYEPSAYVKQAQSGVPADWGPWPGTYLDVKGIPMSPCTYLRKGQTGTMDATWLASLCAVATLYQMTNNVPVWVNQVGLPFLTPDSTAYYADALDTLNNAGIGWCVWQHKHPAGVNAIGNPFGSDNSGGDDGLYWQDGATQAYFPQTAFISVVTAKIAAVLG